MPATKTKKVWVFTVRGEGSFPFDMLRYDRAFPQTETDSTRMGWSPRIGPHGPREVSLITESSAPTDGRWESFGWTVVRVEEMRY